MRKTIYIIGAFFLLLLAVGCGGGETETTVPAPPAEPVEADTDIREVAAKPQLIEFYANW
jgi:hypothetical protein